MAIGTQGYESLDYSLCLTLKDMGFDSIVRGHFLETKHDAIRKKMISYEELNMVKKPLALQKLIRNWNEELPPKADGKARLKILSAPTKEEAIDWAIRVEIIKNPNNEQECNDFIAAVEILAREKHRAILSLVDGPLFGDI